MGRGRRQTVVLLLIGAIALTACHRDPVDPAVAVDGAAVDPHDAFADATLGSVAAVVSDAKTKTSHAAGVYGEGVARVAVVAYRDNRAARLALDRVDATA